MTHDVDSKRYARLSRSATIRVLQKANLEPLKLVAHRDGTFTARYRRKTALSPESYEHRLEFASEYPIAVFKRPNKSLDRGPYTTLQFAFGPKFTLKAATSNGGSTSKAADAAATAPELVTQLSEQVRNIQQLSTEAEQMVKDASRQEHLLVILEELHHHATRLGALVQQLAR